MSTPVSPIPDFSKIRADFPHAEERVWFAAAERHPYSVHTISALERYIQHRACRTTDIAQNLTPAMQTECKERFANLINAKPSEIAFVQSTTDGENIVLAGLGLSQPNAKVAGNTAVKCNVVVDDLHFEASKYMYKALEEAGNIEVRVVHHRNWQIEVEDIAAAIDDETLLVSVALVSQVNGYKADMQAISKLAHDHGAYVYADLIQAVGCTPVDVEAMGFDFAAANTYKWLMGDWGFGFLYVKESLQDVVQQTRYCLRQVESVDDFAYEPKAGAVRYEGSQISFLAGVCAYEGLKYLDGLGVEQIRSHVKPLTDRLLAELPSLGYCPITPPDSPSPIVSFLPADVEQTQAKLERAFGHQVLSFREWYWTNPDGQREMVKGIRFGVSVYNNDEDIDRLIEALA